MIIVTVIVRGAGHKERKKGVRRGSCIYVSSRKRFLPLRFGLERERERENPGLKCRSRDDGRARADYRESSKIVIHRSRSRVEREPTIISLITGFLEGERASNGGSTNPDETGPRANAERNGIQPTRFSTSPATNCSFRTPFIRKLF